MRSAIRSLAILVLLITATTGYQIRTLNACGGIGMCTPIPPTFGANRTLTLVLLGVAILSSVVVVTLSTALHNRLEHREWFAVFLILTGLLVLSPAIQFLSGVTEDAALQVMSILAAVASLIALASTFISGATTKS